MVAGSGTCRHAKAEVSEDRGRRRERVKRTEVSRRKGFSSLVLVPTNVSLSQSITFCSADEGD